MDSVGAYLLTELNKENIDISLKNADLDRNLSIEKQFRSEEKQALHKTIDHHVRLNQQLQKKYSSVLRETANQLIGVHNDCKQQGANDDARCFAHALSVLAKQINDELGVAVDYTKYLD